MPHSEMQKYVNVDFSRGMAIVGLLGIASFLFRMLVQFARERGLKGFTADVLTSNRGMMKVLEKSGLTVEARVEAGVYEVTMPFETDNGPKG